MDPEKQKRDDDKCAICLEKLSSVGRGKKLLKTRCDHAFHSDCLLNWLQPVALGTCPICREAITEADTTAVVYGKHMRRTRWSDRIKSMQQKAVGTASSATGSTFSTAPAVDNTIQELIGDTLEILPAGTVRNFNRRLGEFVAMLQSVPSQLIDIDPLQRTIDEIVEMINSMGFNIFRIEQRIITLQRTLPAGSPPEWRDQLELYRQINQSHQHVHGGTIAALGTLPPYFNLGGLQQFGNNNS